MNTLTEWILVAILILGGIIAGVWLVNLFKAGLWLYQLLG
jgi:hypothetical protein